MITPESVPWNLGSPISSKWRLMEYVFEQCQESPFHPSGRPFFQAALLCSGFITSFAFSLQEQWQLRPRGLCRCYYSALSLMIAFAITDLSVDARSPTLVIS